MATELIGSSWRRSLVAWVYKESCSTMASYPDETAALIPQKRTKPLFRMDHHYVPAAFASNHAHRRSTALRVFLFLTEPNSSLASAVFYIVLISAIFLQNIILVLQTMPAGQVIPEKCDYCAPNSSTSCLCPPDSLPWTDFHLKWSVMFFSMEWILRVVSWTVAPETTWSTWWNFLTSWSTILDALAIFPFYAEQWESSNSLMSLRLLRLFRVFQVVRLGQYDASFTSLSAVLVQSMPYLKLLSAVLCFAAVFFGSLLYWLERGDWGYDAATEQYAYLRTDPLTNRQDVSPFNSIPAACWWFVVTATTVGYGDISPVTMAGKTVAVAAMLFGVLVIAFPVSVFSDLWSKQWKGDDGETEKENRLPKVDEKVEMSKEDFRLLLEHMKRVDESQRVIRSILDDRTQI